jgi:hypothetical protein
MATCLQINPSTLKVLYNSSTNSAMSVDCAEPVGCQFCPSGAPSQITATFSDVTAPTCYNGYYEPDGEFWTYAWNSGNDLVSDGPWTLDQDFTHPVSGPTGGCRWGLVLPAAIHIDRYSDVGCTSLISDEDVDIVIQVGAYFPIWPEQNHSANVLVNGSTGDSHVVKPFEFQPASVIEGEVTTDCMNVTDIPNLITNWGGTVDLADV